MSVSAKKAGLEEDVKKVIKLILLMTIKLNSIFFSLYFLWLLLRANFVVALLVSVYSRILIIRTNWGFMCT